MTSHIFVHAGGHRTGSSSFQMCLAENRGTLTDHGFALAYPERDHAPGGTLKMKLPGPYTVPERIAKQVGKLTEQLRTLSQGPQDKLLISDENLIGRMVHFYIGHFQPAAGVRLQTFSNALRLAELDLPITILLVTRSYDTLFESAFRKRAEEHPMPDFASLAPTMTEFIGGWPGLVDTILMQLKPARVVVVDYGARGSSRQLLARLTDLPEDTFVEPQANANVSASDAALTALQAAFHAREKLDRHAIDAVIAQHASDGPRTFSRFAPEQTAVLRARYERDLDLLAQNPHIDLIRPTSGQ